MLDYKRLASAAIAAHGGRYLVRSGKSEVLDGDWQPRRLVVLEFDSVEKAKAWRNSPEYAEAKKVRDTCARGTHDRGRRCVACAWIPNEKRGLAAAFGMSNLVELNGIEPMTS